MAQAAPSRHQGHHAKPTHRLLPPTSTILKTIKYEAQMGSRMRKLNCSTNQLEDSISPKPISRLPGTVRSASALNRKRAQRCLQSCQMCAFFHPVPSLANCKNSLTAYL